MIILCRESCRATKVLQDWLLLNYFTYAVTPLVGNWRLWNRRCFGSISLELVWVTGCCRPIVRPASIESEKNKTADHESVNVFKNLGVFPEVHENRLKVRRGKGRDRKREKERKRERERERDERACSCDRERLRLSVREWQWKYE